MRDFFARTRGSVFSRCVWTKYGRTQVFIRRSKRSMGWCLDLATIEVAPELQRMGLFGAFLLEIESHRQVGESSYVENVLNPDIIPHLLRRGYTRVNDEDYAGCFYLKRET